jgi:hypothetical protein
METADSGSLAAATGEGPLLYFVIVGVIVGLNADPSFEIELLGDRRLELGVET